MTGLPFVIDGLEKSYGDRQVLHQMTLSVQPGEIYGFVGANGAGKTTTMRIALGVLASDGGRVLLGDKPMDDATRRTVGYMPEERGLYPKDKIGEQLRYFARLHGMSREKAVANTESLLETLNLSDRINDSLESLSLGNQQRVQLAAALVHEPVLLVLDEPFSGLDPVAVRVMSDVLRQRAEQGVPVIFSSHQLDLVERLCDRVGIIQDGKMLVEGTVEKLQAGGPRLVRVNAPDAPAGWAASLAGVESVESDHRGRDVLTMRKNPDGSVDLDAEQSVLQHALGYGPVREFAPVAVPLTELYQEVVQS